MKVRVRMFVLLATAGLLLVLGSDSRSQLNTSQRTSWSEVYKALDANQDGDVDADELSDLKRVAELILKMCNKDDDIGLSADELVDVKYIALHADTSQNGYVTRDELDNWLAAWRKELLAADKVSLEDVLDTNENGFNDFDVANEVRATRTIMKRFDTNEDRLLSADELDPIKESLRDLRPVDADGKGVTIKQVTNWLVKWRAQLRKIAEKKVSLEKLLDLKDNGLTAFDLSNESRAASHVMDRLDLDKNSVLSPEEIADTVEPLNEADANDDKLISRRELEDWLIAWRDKLK